MNLKAIELVSRHAGDLIVKNSSTLLTALGVGGFLGTVFMAVKATKPALKAIDEAEIQREKDSTVEGFPYEPLTNMEIAKLIWKFYLPPAVLGVTTIGCIIGSNAINLRKQAVLASLYSIAQTTMHEYEQKVIETIGENKEKKIKEEILQDRLDKNPVGNVIITGKGETLCFDSLSGRYFKSDVETLRRIQNDFNESLLNERYLTLNELYDLLDLDQTELGRNMGWSTEYGMLDFSFSAKLAKDNTPCIVLEYRIEPRKL